MRYTTMSGTEGRLFTPFPCGEMPEGVRRDVDGPPFGRLRMILDHDPVDGETVTDHESGHDFVVTLDVPCGFGCRCAAEVRWVSY